MNNNSKKLLKGLLVFCLVTAIGVMGLQPLSVQAASNKALSVSYKFNGQSYEKDGDKCGYNNGYSIITYGANKKTAIKNLKFSMDVYIPKKALNKEGASVDVSPYLDLMSTKDEYVGDVISKYTFTAVREDGVVRLYAWDNEKEKSVKASTYASCKAGTGTYKSYYVIKLKNVPFVTKMTKENGKTATIKSSTKYAFNMGFSICGQNTKGSGIMYIDNMKVVSGSKTVVNQDFSKKPKFYNAFNKDKELSSKKVKIAAF